MGNSVNIFIRVSPWLSAAHLSASAAAKFEAWEGGAAIASKELF